MSRIILTSAKVIDGQGVGHDDKAVVIEGKRISSVRDGLPDDLSANDRVIDLPGKTIMPGMCIGHFHPEYDGLGTMMQNMNLGTERPPGVVMAYAIKNMKIAINAGFTAALGTASLYDTDVCLDMAMEEGVCIGPRIVPCSPHLMGTATHSPQTPWWLGATNLGLDQGQLTGADAFRKFIREETAKGVRMIKILPSGGHGIKETRGMRNISLDELNAAIETAHDRGAWIRAHVAYRDQVLETVKAGIDIIDHADELDDECIEAMVKHGTYFCPTIGMMIATIRWEEGKPFYEFMKYYPSDESYITHFGAQLRKAKDAGIKMLIGDDYGPKYGFFSDQWGKEMNMYIDEMHFEAADVIKMVTRNGAGFFGDETGDIIAGKSADLLILDFDPLTDGFEGFSNPEKSILAVMKQGEFAKCNLLSVASQN